MDPGRACAFLDAPQQPHAGDDGRHDAHSNSSHQIPARVIEADSARAVDEGRDLDRRRPPLRAKDLEHEAGTRDAAKKWRSVPADNEVALAPHR
jgi:hypothetical protein